jgi:uncharacterized protein Yka (UPF0111/DUF47 family)
VKRHWFLPQSPDVLGTLRRQTDLTVDGMTAYAAWADGDPEQGTVLRQTEHAADAVRRELAQQLRVAFTTPVDAEDLFTLSERLDAVLNKAKNVVRDAELMEVAPSEATATMAHEALFGVRHLATALGALPKDPKTATDEADAAVKNVRHIEKRYVRAIRELSDGDDLPRALLLREHMEDCLQVGERIERVADRVWYAVVKEQ